MTAKHTTRRIPVPARLYDQALAFCNRVRKMKWMKPIKRLPAGKACDPKQCPCGIAAEVVVGDLFWALTYADWMRDTNLYFGAPRQFIVYWDKNASADHRCLPVRIVTTAKAR